MFSRVFTASMLLALGASLPIRSQTVSSDPQGVAALTQAVNASGVANPLKPIQDFTATGTITYFWAGEEVSAPATVRGRGPDQFRLDANLPEGTRSLAVSRWQGALKESNGKLNQIPLHNTMNLGILTFPYPNIAAALNDPLTLVSYLGVVDLGGRQVHQVRVQRHFSSEADPQGTMAKLSTKDYFVDTQTGLVVKTLDMTHPNETFTEDLLHEVELGNYAVVEGVQVPMVVREKIIGQTIWELRLTSIHFNSGFTDLDFALQ